MSRRDRAEAWLLEAPVAFRQFLRQLTFHHRVRWDVPDYVEDEVLGENGDGRMVVDDILEAEAFSSYQPGPFDAAGVPHHGLLLDIDVPAWLIPSSTAGHSHLYVQLAIPDEDLWEFLEAAVKIGLVEPGYVSACKSRGMTSLRAPWVVKGQEHLEDPPEVVEVPTFVDPDATVTMVRQEEPF